MELKYYATILWKWGWLIALATVMAGGTSYWTAAKTPPVYQATTTLRVGQFLENPNPRGWDFTASQQLAQEYAQSVQRQPVLQATIDALGLQWHWRSLATNVRAIVIGNQLLQIGVTDTNPERARILADEIARQLILQSPTYKEEQEQRRQRQFTDKQLADLQGKIENAHAKIADLEDKLEQEVSAVAIANTQSQIAALQQQITGWQATYASLLQSSTGGLTNYLTVFEPASTPTAPVGSNTLANVLIAASLGFTLAAAAAVLIEFLDDSIKDDEDLVRILGLPVLGTIQRVKGDKNGSSSLVTLTQPQSPATEAFRLLRTNIQFMGVTNDTSTVLVTSAVMGEGKTTVASNLAIMMAQSGNKVILVDADMRRPDVHRRFAVENEAGLSTLLLDDSLSLSETLVDTVVSGLKLLPSGSPPPNPGELLGSERMKRRLAQMKEVAQVVVIDSPPLLPLADASILGGLSSRLILVSRVGHTRRAALRQAKKAVEQIGLTILGVVLNDVKAGRGYYYRYYYAGHHSGRPNGKGDKQAVEPLPH